MFKMKIAARKLAESRMEKAFEGFTPEMKSQIKQHPKFARKRIQLAKELEDKLRGMVADELLKDPEFTNWCIKNNKQPTPRQARKFLRRYDNDELDND
jgi:hypothetical protein